MSMPNILPAPSLAANKLEHLCGLDFEGPLGAGCNTSITCTLGPACETPEVIERMLDAGMRVCRLNMSYGSHSVYADLIKRVRQCAKVYSQKAGYDVRVAFAIDTKGPEIRTGKMDSMGPSHVQLQENDEILLTIIKDYEEKGSAHMVYVDYSDIVNMVKPNTKIFLDDGYIGLVVVEVLYDTIRCVVEMPGVLQSYKNVIVRGAKPDLPPLSEQDIADLKFTIDNEVDYVFVSYMNDPSLLVDIRRILRMGGKHIKLISKIENMFGLRNFDAILEESDGVLISRIALGMDLDGIQVWMAQKQIAAKCRRAFKPALMATQLVVSMINNPKPHRREVYDIIGAIMDGASGLVLSSATSIGSYPVECVEALVRCARHAHAIFWARSMYENLLANLKSPTDSRMSTLVTIMQAAIQSVASAIIVISPNNAIAQKLSAFRAHCPIVALVQTKIDARNCNLYGGLYAFPYKEGSLADWAFDTDEERLEAALKYCKVRQFAESGRPVVVVTEPKIGSCCSIRIVNV